MLVRIPSVVALVLSAASLLVFTGCSSEPAPPASGGAAGASGAPADPHDVPLTEDEIKQIKSENAKFSDAVTTIASLRDTIRDGIAAGTPAKAHRPLDKLDVVLGALPEIAQNSNVAKDHWQAVGENSQKLRDLFNKVHADIDTGKSPDYKSLSAEIDSAVQALKDIPAG
jgi:hypothetical protein